MYRNVDTERGMDSLTNLLQNIEHPLETADDLDPLLERIGDSRYVLLGEASHGTSEYYTWRARLSQRLIREKGFSFIAVEGDWPDCYAVNRYIKGYDGSGDNARSVLHAFERWPTWMWANWEMVALSEWLRSYNDAQDEAARVGFYGLDVYSLWQSMESIIGYLEENASEALEAAKRAYLCFEPYGEDAQKYAWTTTLVPETCENAVVDLLSEVRRNVLRSPDGAIDDAEARLDVEQNALVAVEAERYYRTMVRGGSHSWNVRERHMLQTLRRLMSHHNRHRADRNAKAIIWAHNTHIGDARATDMAQAGMINLGQLVREQHGHDGVVAVGFGSNRGSVIAGQGWGAPMETMHVPSAQPRSWENVCHSAGAYNKLLLTQEMRSGKDSLSVRGHRAIGVVYRPEGESRNYVPTILPNRYDAFLYCDETQALHPLHLDPQGAVEPETYPWGV